LEGALVVVDDVARIVVGIDATAGEHPRAPREHELRVPPQHQCLESVDPVAHEHHRRGRDGRLNVAVAVCRSRGGHGRGQYRDAPDRVSVSGMRPSAVERYRRAPLPRESPMKPAAFEYHAPESITDVAALLAEHGDDAKVLAGGQSLVPLLAMRLTRFPHIVDLNRVAELQGIERQNGSVTTRAMQRQSVAGPE